MKPKTLILLAVAGGCGLVAMLMVQQAMSGNQTVAKAETARVLVAIEQIDSGMRLTETNVSFKEVAVESLPKDDIITTLEQYEERAAQVPMLPGDIVRMSKLTEKGGWGRSVAIPMGMRVATITVNDEHTSSGLLSPGDRVDVLVTFRGKGNNNGIVSKTKTLLEYIEVFAMDAKTATKLENGKESGKAKNVSLLLTPEQVTFIRLAENKGALSLSWRHRLDDELVQTKDVDGDLLEELSGSYGGTNDRPMYDQELGNSEFQDREPTQEVVVEKPAASAFLDKVEVSEPAPQVIEAPAKPQWVLQVYNGNSPVEQRFDLPETVTLKENDLIELPDADLTDASGHKGLSEIVFGFWPKNNGASVPATADDRELKDINVEDVNTNLN